jgi:hypothetical protein
MFTMNLGKKVLMGNPNLSVAENVYQNLDSRRLLYNTSEAAYETLPMSPLDDYGGTWLLKYKPNVSEKTLWFVKSAINHSIDAGQGAFDVWRKGEYQAADGTLIKNPWTAAVVSFAESFYMSQKTSNPRSTVMELLPQIVEADIKRAAGRGEKNITHPLLEREMGKKPDGSPITVRDLIIGESNVSNYNRAIDKEAFGAIFTQKLLEKGVAPEDVMELYAKALEKTGPFEKHLGEILPFLSRVVQENELLLLTRGKLRAEQVFKHKNALGGPLNLHHRLNAGDTLNATKTGFVNAEVEKAVDRVATDYGIKPEEFRKYILKRVAAQPLVGTVETLKSMAKQKLLDDAYTGRP